MKSCLGNLILLVKKKEEQNVKDSSLIKFMFYTFVMMVTDEFNNSTLNLGTEKNRVIHIFQNVFQ